MSDRPRPDSHSKSVDPLDAAAMLQALSQSLNPPPSALEADYAQRLLALFAQVTPQKPEKGIRTLLLRARQRVATESIDESTALADIYEGARQRTEARVQLLSHCPLRQS